MSELREELERRLLEMPHLTIATWKDTDLVCVSFRGKEVGHFHGDNILDLRLTVKIIREEDLSRSISKQIHPNRSLNSRWIGVAFDSPEEIDQVLYLVGRACEEIA